MKLEYRDFFIYGGVFRRRLRRAQLVFRHLFNPRLYPKCFFLSTYWFDELPNFGDLLTVPILGRYGIAVTRSALKEADVVGIGSLLDSVDPSYAGVIWGSGSFGDDCKPLPNANVLAVRGPRTLGLLGLEETDVLALGDPGLLASRVFSARRSTDKIGIVAHYSHLDSPIIRSIIDRLGSRAIWIDVRSSPRRVCREISSCAAVVTTSLHGLIVADSYNVPAAWSMLSPVIVGGDFKFVDYEQVVLDGGISRRVELLGDEDYSDLLAMAMTASCSRVQQAIDDLETSISSLKGVIRQSSRSPLSLLRR